MSPTACQSGLHARLERIVGADNPGHLAITARPLPLPHAGSAVLETSGATSSAPLRREGGLFWDKMGLPADRSPSRRRPSPSDMTFEAKRSRHIAVAIAEIRVKRGIAVSLKCWALVTPLRHCRADPCPRRWTRRLRRCSCGARRTGMDSRLPRNARCVGANGGHDFLIRMADHAGAPMRGVAYPAVLPGSATPSRSS